VSDATEEEYFLHTVASQSSKPIFVDLQINDKTLQMELDTGAAFTIISERTRKTVFPELPLLKCPIRLKTYTDERIAVLGQLNVHVKYADQRVPLVLLVVAGDGPTLLGRNWLRYIRLDWQRIHAVSKSDTATTLKSLLEKQSDLLKDELGKVSKIQATLHVCTNARPRLFKPRQVPFASKHVMNKQADQVSHHNQHAKARHFSIEQNVMVRNLRPGKKWVPGVIKKQLGPLTFLVEVENGILWKRHIDHLLDNATSHTVTSTSTPVDVDQESFTPSVPSDEPEDTLETDTEHSAPRYPDCVRNPPDRFLCEQVTNGSDSVPL
jgi:hypothetical protein